MQENFAEDEYYVHHDNKYALDICNVQIGLVYTYRSAFSAAELQKFLR